jgi:hypothetical protein
VRCGRNTPKNLNESLNLERKRTMKRTLTAALFAMSAATVYAGNQYLNDAGEQDQHAPIAKSDEYRNDAEQSFPQLG